MKMIVMFSFFSTTKRWQEKSGFTLIEIIVAIGIFAIFAVGIYSGIQYVFRIVYNSRVNIIETSILNEQIESIRNMNYHDVGIVNGSPSGLLTRNEVIVRNGVTFLIIRTIRNVDDPFDGLVTDEESPDLTPADYKIVDVSVLCTSCNQKTPSVMSTYVAPKYLEGNPDNGAMYIHVYDFIGQPIQGAEVSVFSTSTDPTYDFMDTTDNFGRLVLVDMATGTQAYHITVTKDGYSVSGTTAPSPENPSPSVPPLTVLSQQVSPASFLIDLSGEMEVQLFTEQCDPVSGEQLFLRGEKLLSGAEEPPVYVTDMSVTTNQDGKYVFSKIPADMYDLSIDTDDFTIIGASPNESVPLAAGAHDFVTLYLRTAALSGYGLRLNVLTSQNSQPIAGATVAVSGTGYNKQQITGQGSRTQTTWVGGGGVQYAWSNNATGFWFSAGYVGPTYIHGLNHYYNPGRIQTAFGCYPPSSGDNCGGWSSEDVQGLSSVTPRYQNLESSTFDFGENPTYEKISWSPGYSFTDRIIQFQIATATTSDPGSWTYLGPDGTSGSYYTLTEQNIASVHTGDRYLRYKVYTEATNPLAPIAYINDVTITYNTQTGGCVPFQQVYFDELTAQTYSIQVSADGYTTYNTSTPISEHTVLDVHLDPV